jgi:hypothetical protein
MEEFNRLLTEYKTQYLQFLSTGDQSFRAAYERTLEAIEAAISAKREEVDADKAAMKHFAASYQANNDELEGVVARATALKSAQDQHDEYITAKDRYEEASVRTTPVVDVSTGYSILLRIGLFLILLPILLYLGYVMPMASAGFGMGASSVYRSVG